MDCLELTKECEVCSERFEWLYEKQVHMSQSHPDVLPPHTCCVCRHTCNSYHNLLTHFRKHSGIRPYTCSDCDKTFTYLNNLTTHLTAMHSINYRDITVEKRRLMYNNKGEMPTPKLLKQLKQNGTVNQSHHVSSTSVSPMQPEVESCDSHIQSAPSTIAKSSSIDDNDWTMTPAEKFAIVNRAATIEKDKLETVVLRSGRVVKPKLMFSPSRSPAKNQLEQRLVKKYLRMHSPSNKRLFLNSDHKRKLLNTPRCNLTEKLNAISKASDETTSVTPDTTKESPVVVSSSVSDVALPQPDSIDDVTPLKLDTPSKLGYLDRLKSNFALSKIKSTLSQHSKPKEKAHDDPGDIIHECDKNPPSVESIDNKSDCSVEMSNRELFPDSPFKVEPQTSETIANAIGSPTKDRGLFSLFSSLCDEKPPITSPVTSPKKPPQFTAPLKPPANHRNDSELRTTIEEVKTKMSKKSTLPENRLKTKLITQIPVAPPEKHLSSAGETSVTQEKVKTKKRRHTSQKEEAQLLELLRQRRLLQSALNSLPEHDTKFIADTQALIAFRSRVYCLFLVLFPKLRKTLRTIKKETSQIDEFLYSVSSSLVDCDSCPVCCRLANKTCDGKSMNDLSLCSHIDESSKCVKNNNIIKCNDECSKPSFDNTQTCSNVSSDITHTSVNCSRFKMDSKCEIKDKLFENSRNSSGLSDVNCKQNVHTNRETIQQTKSTSQSLFNTQSVRPALSNCKNVIPSTSNSIDGSELGKHTNSCDTKLCNISSVNSEQNTGECTTRSTGNCTTISNDLTVSSVKVCGGFGCDDSTTVNITPCVPSDVSLTNNSRCDVQTSKQNKLCESNTIKYPSAAVNKDASNKCEFEGPVNSNSDKENEYAVNEHTDMDVDFVDNPTDVNKSCIVKPCTSTSFKPNPIGENIHDTTVTTQNSVPMLASKCERDILNSIERIEKLEHVVEHDSVRTIVSETKVDIANDDIAMEDMRSDFSNDTQVKMETCSDFSNATQVKMETSTDYGNFSPPRITSSISKSSDDNLLSSQSRSESYNNESNLTSTHTLCNDNSCSASLSTTGNSQTSSNGCWLSTNRSLGIHACNDDTCRDMCRSSGYRVELCNSPEICLAELQTHLSQLLPVLFPDVAGVCHSIDSSNVGRVLDIIITRNALRR